METDQKSEKSRKICVKRNMNCYRHFKEYCRNTSIHGFRYLGENRTIWEKVWWGICITICISLGCVMIYAIFLKYSYYPVIVTFSMKETRLQTLPYPAVTICPRAKISQKYFNLTEYFKKVLDKVPTTKEENKLRDMSATICDFETEIYRTKKIEEAEFFEFIRKSSPEIFYYCQYLNKEYNCSDLFTPILTDDGICYTYNILDKSDIYTSDTEFFEDFHKAPKSQWDLENGYHTKNIDAYPRRALKVGARNQLMVMLQTHNDDIEFQCPLDESGYRLSVHLSSDIPEVPENYILMPLQHKVVGAVVPHVIKTSQGVKNFEPSKRDCFFQSERPLKFFKTYSQENCLLECKTNYVLKVCGCVAFHMPRKHGTPICFLDKLDCIENALDKEIDEESLEKETCNCRPSCTSITYNMDLSYNTVIYDLLNATLREEIDFDNHAYTILSLYFKNNHVETKERNEIYGFSDVISNFGGLLGLFTGFSILSFLEILYFLSLRIWGNIRIYGTWISPENT